MTEPAPPPRLVITHPPGRATRKARAFASDIARLRGEGHTCEAIRQALAAAGVVVSRSTVQREALRATATKRWPLVEHADAQPAAARSAPADARVPPARDASRRAVQPRTGIAEAEEFMRGRITNPLLRHPPDE